MFLQNSREENFEVVASCATLLYMGASGLTNKEGSTVLCSVEKHTGGGKARTEYCRGKTA